jgi:hypothetical protein
LPPSAAEEGGEKAGDTPIGADFRKKGGQPDKREPDMRK